MKYCLVALFLLLFPAALLATNSYATNFPLTEYPISEKSRWINGKMAGLDWANVRTTPGLAFGTETDKAKYDDSTAILAGTWGANQMAQAQVHTVNQDSRIYEEVELRLRTTISAHSITGYEINLRCTTDGTQYAQIVRWNGPLGNFTLLANVKGPGLHDGDTVKATIVGSMITAYINGAQVVQAVDSTYATGSPGMGFYIEGGSASQQSDYGFTSFSASDTSSSGIVVQNSAMDWSQAGIPESFYANRRRSCAAGTNQASNSPISFLDGILPNDGNVKVLIRGRKLDELYSLSFT